MDLLLLPETQANIQRISERHKEFITKLTTFTNVSTIRQRGTLLAFDLQVNEQTSYFNNIRDTAYNFLLDRGVLMRPLGNVLYLMPPYCTNDEQLAYTYQQIENLLISI